MDPTVNISLYCFHNLTYIQALLKFFLTCEYTVSIEYQEHEVTANLQVSKELAYEPIAHLDSDFA